VTEHTIIFSADITPQSVNNFTNIIVNLAQGGATNVTIGMNSNGGNVVAGVMLYNTLCAVPFTLTMHNIGNVDSIANVIFMAGATRKSCAGSTFMYHGISFAGIDGETLDEIKLREKLDVITAGQKRLATIISDRSDLSVKQGAALFKQQSTRGAEWALNKGIVSAVEPLVYPASGNFYSFFG
jgi:ATP-dependent Clp protease protease subunit